MDAGPGCDGDRAAVSCPFQSGADLAHPAPDGLHRAGPGAPSGRTRRGRRDRLDQGDLAPGGKTVRDQDAWLCFADESGQMLRPPNARTWSRRGHTPLVRARAAGPGRISLAGLVCRKAGRRTRLIFRMLVHHGRKGEKKGFREKDFASLLDAAHQQLGGITVLVWDNYSRHVDATIARADRKAASCC